MITKRPSKTMLLPSPGDHKINYLKIDKKKWVTGVNKGVNQSGDQVVKTKRKTKSLSPMP
jgi:hypothetical protein